MARRIDFTLPNTGVAVYNGNGLAKGSLHYRSQIVNIPKF